RDHREVRHVAGREKQCPLAPGERGELLLELRVLRAVTADEVRRPASRTGMRCTLAHRGGEGGVAGEPEIVVAAEIDELAPAGECQGAPGRCAMIARDAGGAARGRP